MWQTLVADNPHCGINKLGKSEKKIQFSHSTSRANMALANNMSEQANKQGETVFPPLLPLSAALLSTTLPPLPLRVTAQPVRKLIKTSGKSAAIVPATQAKLATPLFPLPFLLPYLPPPHLSLFCCPFATNISGTSFTFLLHCVLSKHMA